MRGSALAVVKLLPDPGHCVRKSTTHSNDPLEHRNLVSEPTHAEVNEASTSIERLSMKRFALVLIAVLGSSVQAADWPAWRGPTGQGFCEEKDLPLNWSDKTKWSGGLRPTLSDDLTVSAPGACRGCGGTRSTIGCAASAKP